MSETDDLASGRRQFAQFGLSAHRLPSEEEIEARRLRELRRAAEPATKAEIDAVNRRLDAIECALRRPVREYHFVNADAGSRASQYQMTRGVYRTVRGMR